MMLLGQPQLLRPVSLLALLLNRYFILPLSTPHLGDAPGLATRLLGDYRDGTFTR